MSIRVLVVEDSMTIRKYIVEILSSMPGFEVVGEAGDGRRAIELCQELRPSVITMDMMLPVMSGVAATEYIMAYCPTPILIVSASTNRGELFKTYEALAAGAVDVLEKPASAEPDRMWQGELASALRVVSRVSVITHPRAKLASPGRAGRRTPGSPRAARAVGIGASTGGPGALKVLLQGLPKDFPLPILLVMHVSEPFGAALAEWLDGQGELTVRHAVDGEGLPAGGAVLMAPPGRHLELAGARLRLTGGPERHSCRPSVDVLFESMSREMGDRAVACLLTGMGKDGARGMLAVVERGGLTIAQDEASSVIFGMPGEAVRLGAAKHVLPLSEIAPFLMAEFER